MNNIKFAFLPVVLLSVTLGACGGTTDAEAIEALLADVEQTFCTNLVTCGQFPDIDTCLETGDIDTEQTLAEFTTAIEAGTVVFNSDSADACRQAFQNFVPCDKTIDRQTFEQLDTACDAVFVGQVATGETCYNDIECANQGLCIVQDCPEDTCCAGACQGGEPDAPLAAIGQPCDDFDDCVYEAYCQIDFTTGDGTCTELLPEGAECEDFGSCQAGSLCDIDFTTFTGTCIRPPEVGETCNPDSLVGCNLDLICDPADSTCKRPPVVGEACDETQESACVGFAGCVAGTCVLRPGAGESCAELDCMGDMPCDGDVCVQRPPGLVCTTPAE